MLRPRTEWESFIKHRKSMGPIFTALVGVAFVIVTLRLWHLQIVQYSSLADRAENNRVRQMTLDGRRGKILDRNGFPMVDSRPSFQLSLIPEDVDNPRETLDFLRRRVDFDVDSTLDKMRHSPSFQTIVIKKDIDREDVAFVEENRLDLPGVFLEVKAWRNYIFGQEASHILGYLGAISSAQLAKAPKSVYSMDDFIGQYGIEKVHERTLRGAKGYKRVEVDAAGRELALLEVIRPKSGHDLRLTIDFTTQTAAERAFEGKMGAAVAIDPNNGDIIAALSKPGFDPNVFAHGISGDSWKKFIQDEFHPLQNRITRGQYPPGSTFKIIMAAAALEEGIVSPETTIYCPGHYRLGQRTYRCWKKAGHGSMNLTSALIQSCDVYFYTVGLRLGIDRIAKYAKMFGLGKRTNINLGAESPGLVPSTDWKKKARGKPWIMGETVSCSIGQGYNLVTPIQQAIMIAAIANGGKLVTPRLVNSPRPGTGDRPGANPKSVSVSPDTISVIRNALRLVVTAPHGTAWRIKNGPYSYAGKTGTSQVVRMKKNETSDIEEIKFKHRDHALFVGFAPFDDPKIAVAVIVEHAGHGGEAAAPVARKIMDAYLQKINVPPSTPQITGHVTDKSVLPMENPL